MSNDKRLSTSSMNETMSKLAKSPDYGKSQIVAVRYYKTKINSYVL